MSKFRISVNNLILGYHGNITIATICSFLATCPFTKVPHTFLIPCVPLQKLSRGGEGGGGEWEREGGGKGWEVEEEKEGKGERVCVWARKRGREVRRKGVRKGGREGRGRQATKELSTYHCLVTQSPGSLRS